MKRRALFIDRDGTLVHRVHYPSRAEQLRLYTAMGPVVRPLATATGGAATWRARNRHPYA
ncbi:MAG: hypothetical protein M3Y39_17240 [Chloroflexota bacterium]|nr:hypothetical protein [Chloroflexota bacterium]